MRLEVGVWLSFGVLACVGCDTTGIVGEASGGTGDASTSGSEMGPSTGAVADGGDDDSGPIPTDSDSDDESGVAPSICGDGQLDPGEVCDDGNDAGHDGCSADCRVSAVGSWEVSPPGEYFILGVETDANGRVLLAGNRTAEAPFEAPVIQILGVDGELALEVDSGLPAETAVWHADAIGDRTYLFGQKEDVAWIYGVDFNGTQTMDLVLDGFLPLLQADVSAGGMVTSTDEPFYGLPKQFLLSFDAQGNSTVAQFGRVDAVAIADDGALIVNYNDGFGEQYLTRLDAALQPVGEPLYLGIGPGVLLASAPDGGVLMVSDVLTRLDADLQTVWQVALDEIRVQHVEAAGDAVVLAGSRRNPVQNNDEPMVMGLSAAGAVQWSRHFVPGALGRSSGGFLSVSIDPSGAVVAGGAMYTPGSWVNEEPVPFVVRIGTE